MDYDRLNFPLIQLPMDMAEESTDGSILNPFLKSRLMWAGFALPFLTLSTMGLNHYFSFIPQLEFSNRLWLFRNTMVL